jgi:hypothetical protein
VQGSAGQRRCAAWEPASAIAPANLGTFGTSKCEPTFRGVRTSGTEGTSKCEPTFEPPVPSVPRSANLFSGVRTFRYHRYLEVRTYFPEGEPDSRAAQPRRTHGAGRDM